MRPISFKRHRFPPEIIRHAIWLYARFTLSFRDVEELLAERGIDASYETVRRWFLKFGPSIAANIRRGALFVDGQPIFGPSKTIRGIVVSVLATSICAALIGLDDLVALVARLGPKVEPSGHAPEPTPVLPRG